MHKRYLNFIAILTISLVFSGFKNSDYTLLLKSGEYQLPEGELINSLSGPSVNGSYFRIVQFYNIPSKAEQNAMKQNGIVLFDYLPKNAFLASIPEGISENYLNTLGIRSLSKVQPAMKLTKQLSTEGIPEWALNGDGTAKFVVGFYPSLAPSDITAFLSSANANYKPAGDGFYKVVISEKKWKLLSKSELVYYVQEADPKPVPETFRARSNHRTNTLTQNFSGGTNYDGSGVLVAIGDDGNLYNHVDYTGRLVFQTSVPNGGNHGEMVAGIVFGAGNINPAARGMAPGADVAYFDYFDNGDYYLEGTDSMYNNMGVVITQSSYSNGTNAGYTQLCRDMDKDVRENRALNHVFSAGNAGSSSTSYGAGPGWGNITGGHKQGKNVIATANLTWNDNLNSSSSRGPAYDGRIKPDMGAVGTEVLTTDENNGYRLGGGTSSASPGVSGTLAALYQAYKENNAQALPDGGLMKSILMNTAEDLGNPGPDFYYGYGRINAMRAVEVIENQTYFVDSVSQGETDTISLTVSPNTAEMRVMLYWTDPAGNVMASRALVNDLDFVVEKGTSSWQPWVLDPTPIPANLSSNAVRATDSLNNSEQVTIDNPATGEYKLIINGSSIPTGPQKYYVVYSMISNDVHVTHPLGGEHFTPNTEQIIRWDAPEGNTPFLLEYSIDNGTTWTTISSNVASNLRYFLWTIPNVVTGEAMVRVSRGNNSGESVANFSIIGTPTGLNVVWACQDSMMLGWDPVAGATSYEVSMLGQKYMDSVGTTTQPYFTFTNTNATSTYWLSVKALGPNGCVGERAIAVEKTPGTLFCTFNQDALMSEITSPGSTIPSCQPLSNQDVVIKLQNGGKQSLYNIPVAYQLGNNAIVRDTVTDTIAQGMTLSFTFATGLNLPASGTYTLRTFSELQGDQNTLNDEISTSIQIRNASTQALPYSEDFSSFNTCPTTTNCGATSCALSNGWYNATNFSEDDIDFRTHSGPTTSQGTGPNGDHTSGTGNYLYTEASGSCAFRTTHLVSPCFDLTQTLQPEASIWYHMLGTALGELHVDILADGVWYTDAVAPIVGNQGNNWMQLIIDLTPYVGKTVNIRFRGITGGSWSSDIALDDFLIQELSSAPIADFSSETIACPSEPTALTDMSQPAPSTWLWSISPNTFSFVNGTNANSQSPEVTFNQLGNYSVKLVVSNIFGTDSVEKQNYISVTNGSPTPLIEDFSAPNLKAGWSIDNPDNDIGWARSTPIAGSDNNTTNAMFMNHFSYPSNGETDILETELIDLNNVLNPYMTFDIAHARYSSDNEDALKVEISTDCGQTFVPSGYEKEGQNLATVPDQTTVFSPTSGTQWRTDTIDLSPYANGNITVRFIALNGYGNNLYLDNINVKTDSYVSIEESTVLSESIGLAPNPAKDMVYLRASFEDDRDLEIDIMDISGKLILKLDWKDASNSNNFNIDVSALAEGVYLVRLKDRNEIATKRLIVKR